VRRPWLAFAIIMVAVLVVSMDNSILYIALTTLAQGPPDGLGASPSQLQWFSDAYILAYAGLLLAGGVMGNRFGHRRMVLAGLLGFGVFSAASAVASSPGRLIVCRALMGLCAAFLMPATLAIITYLFPGRARARAISIWSAVVGAALAIGPIVAGALLAHFWWGSVFLVNIPVILLGLITIPLLIPEFREQRRRRFDPLGTLLGAAGLVSLVFGIIRAGDRSSWIDSQVLVPIAIGLVLLAGFAAWELRTDHPALDVHFFADRGFTVAVIALALLFFALFGSVFVMTFYMQEIRGYTALRTGLCVLPLAAAMILAAPLTPRGVARFGARAVAGVGMLIVTAALAGLAQVGRATPIWQFEAGVFALGMGMAFVLPPMTTRIVSTLPQDQAGTSSAVNNTFRQVGGSFGVAVLGTILTGQYRTAVASALAPLPEDLRSPAETSITATRQVLAHLGTPGQGMLKGAVDAFIQAQQLTWSIAAIITLAGAILIVTAYRPLQNSQAVSR
jgi:EmrB/QacA subfamily drug resistance transporter